MNNKENSMVNDGGIDDVSMQDIENSINSGGNDIESPQKKKGKGAFMGVILIIIAIGLFAASGFVPGGMGVQTIAPDAVVADNNGKLVHLTGAINEGEFTDPMFQISAKGVSLERVVEMYQWVEENGLYSKRWDSKLIEITAEDAKAKGINNPAEMPFLSDKWQIEEAKIGVFSLSPNLAKQIGDGQNIPLTQEDFEKLGPDGKQAFKLQDGVYFFGLDFNKPRVGDLKISFKKVDSPTVSVLAQQNGTNLLPFATDNGAIEKLMQGNHTAEDMLSGVNAGGSAYLPLALRGLAGILAFIGLIKILKAPRSPKKPKAPKIQKAKPVNKKEAIAAVTAAVAKPAPAKEFGQEEQNFAEKDFSPAQADDNFSNEITIEPPAPAAEPVNYEPQPTEPAPQPTPQYELPQPPQIEQPPLDFGSAEEEMPAGIEMIGPGSTITEEPSQNQQQPQQFAAAPEFQPQQPAATFDYNESDELPPGIEIIGPDTVQDTISEQSYVAPPPEQEVHEELSIEQDNNIPPPPPGLDYMPTFTPQDDDEEVEFSPEYSPYEMAERPPAFSAENTEFVEEDPVDPEYNFNTDDLPTPPPLDFETKHTEEDTVEGLNYLNYDSELPQDSPQAIDTEEYDEEDEEDYYDDDEDFEEDENTAFAPVPPLPMPAILAGRKMTFDQNTNEAPITPQMPEDPFSHDVNDSAEEHHDVFSDLLNNIPEDFDPNAEMKAPEEPYQPASDGTEEFDPFAEPEDENFSPFATTKN